MNRLRGAVATLLLVALAAAGTWLAVSSLLFAVLLGSLGVDALDDLVRAVAFTITGVAVLVAGVAVLALWLRRSHPVASGVIASATGVLALGIAGPQADGSDAATWLALGGFLLVVCAVPLPGRIPADRFTV